MLGSLRTSLAMMVMAYHLFVGVLPLGTYAVFGFYVISGYLMTLVMHQTYGYSRVGRYAFVINRFLRLYPVYWIAVFLSVCLILMIGSNVVLGYHAKMYLPGSWIDYFSNISMLWLNWSPSSSPSPRLVPPAWALTVEIFFYILICLGISKTFFRVKLWFWLSVAYVLATFLLDYAWEQRYFPFAAASLPFAIGAGIYFLSSSEKAFVLFQKINLPVGFLFLLFLLNCLVWILVTKYALISAVEIGFYMNLVIFSLLVYGLSKGRVIIKLSKQWDKRIGDLSYPIYLFHWQVGLLMSFLIFGEPFHESSGRGFINWIVSLVIVCILAFLITQYIDKPIQRVRQKIKASRLAYERGESGIE